MIRILANDGIHPVGEKLLKEAGYQITTDHIPQEDLPERLRDYDAIIVRSATKVRSALIEQCPKLKAIARAGVGLDNIDVDFAKSKGIEVINTPGASAESVAELVFAHLLSLTRGVHQANRQMPPNGHLDFKALKKTYSKGHQLRGKTIGIVGLGKIGQETAKIALGLGMRVIPVDLILDQVDIGIRLFGSTEDDLVVHLKTQSLDAMLGVADFISLHVPFSGGQAIIGENEIAKMKSGIILVNAARGGVIDEDALLRGLDSGTIAGAGLDVFINEPSPRQDILGHPNISLSPHIGGSTEEAQQNIGVELAEKLIKHFEKNRAPSV